MVANALAVRAVFFDVGETLIDESTEYGSWADWLGVPRHTFSSMFGAVIARGEDYREVFGTLIRELHLPADLDSWSASQATRRLAPTALPARV
jgi:hypothetical protein